MEVPVQLNKFWLALLPATLAAISFTLTVISITAGYSPGVMEDYHVLYFNTSTLGKSFLNDTVLRGVHSAPTMSTVTEAPGLLPSHHAPRDKGLGVGDLTSDLGGIASRLSSRAGDAASAASAARASAGAAATAAASAVASAASAASHGLKHLVDEARAALEDVGDDLADELYTKLGIPQFFSVHLAGLCFGNFTPSATAAAAGFGVTNCTQPLAWPQARDLTGMLDRSLGAGPFQLALADIGMARDAVAAIDEAMAALGRCLQALLALYGLAAVSSGLATVLSAWAVFALPWTAQPGTHRTVRGRTKRVALYSNLAAACLAALFLLLGNLVATLGGSDAAAAIGSAHGAEFGLDAHRGGRFLAVAWAAFAMVLVAAVLWAIQCAMCCVERRQRKRREERERGQRGPAVVMEPKVGQWDAASSVRSDAGNRMVSNTC